MATMMVAPEVIGNGTAVEGVATEPREDWIDKLLIEWLGKIISLDLAVEPCLGMMFSLGQFGYNLVTMCQTVGEQYYRIFQVCAFVPTCIVCIGFLLEALPRLGLAVGQRE